MNFDFIQEARKRAAFVTSTAARAPDDKAKRMIAAQRHDLIFRETNRLNYITFYR